MDKKTAEERLRNAGLRVTPQRLEVLLTLSNSKHPTAEYLIRKVRKKHNSISASTIYNILDTFIGKGVISKIYIPGHVMRYDAMLEKHHHLYDADTNRIEDYFDDELFELIQQYVQHKKIPGFEPDDIKIKLLGKFTDK
ncbi:MAG TPA: transcriptional repressor [Bacteroidetes bacterium]|nr:transcriptional repressor [Bacteroidota bacterium]